ncbi:MAG TPA: M56 family metallopeptidase [Terriglobales bacterium]|nr:M56 family metallopeptidase [Terriglobales bacterium]
MPHIPTLELFSRATLALLFDITLKATFVLALALAAERLLRRRSAAVRHLVLVAALAAIAALPFAARFLPTISTTWLPSVTLPAVAPVTEVAAPPMQAATRPSAVQAPVKNDFANNDATAKSAQQPATTKHAQQPAKGSAAAVTTTTPRSVAPPSGSATTAPAPPPARWPLWLAAAWLLGVSFFTGRVLLGIFRLRGVLARGAAITDPRWTARLRQVTAAMSIRRPVQLLESADVDVPITTGVIYPRVVLPPDAADWSEARALAVLNHELAHVKRLDALTQLLAQAALALHWFNPLAWLAARQMRLEREKACDDFVLAAGARPSEYAHDLLEIVAQLGAKREYAVALAMARKSQFEGRLLALLDPRRNRQALSRAAVLGTALLAAALVLPLAAMQPQQDAPPIPPAPPSPPAAAAPPAQPAPPAPPDADENTLVFGDEALADEQPTPAPTPEAIPPGGMFGSESLAPVAMPAPATTPPPSAAPRAGSGSGSGYGYGYASTPTPAVPPAPSAPSAPSAPAPMMGGGFPDPDCKSSSKTTNVSMSHNTDDNGYQTMNGTWTRGECTLRIHAAGKLAFSADGMQLLGITPDDGFFDVTEVISGATRRVKVEPSAGGLKYTYWRNAQPQEFDAAAREWFGRFMLEFERHTGFSAATRVPMLLQRGGPNAVLNEVDQIESDYVAALYLRTMLDTTKVDAATLRRTLEQAGRQIGSDYEKARILMVIAQKYPLDDEAGRSAFLTSADSLKSDYEHARVLVEILKRPGMSKENARMALASAAKLNSDYERARVLMTMLDARLVDPTMQEMFFNAANGIKSDYEHSRTLIGLLDKVPLSQPIVVRLLQATASINSDYERARVLTSTASKYAVTGEAKNAYLRAANGIKSEYERNRALSALLNSTRM